MHVKINIADEPEVLLIKDTVTIARLTDDSTPEQGYEVINILKENIVKEIIDTDGLVGITFMIDAKKALAKAELEADENCGSVTEHLLRILNNMLE